jgi:predicted aspartyl protease
LRAALEKQGYVAIPLTKTEEGLLVVECKNGAGSWWMVLDTGAARLVLDNELAKKLGLKLGQEGWAIGAGGSQIAHLSSTRGFSIADFDTRKFSRSLEIAVTDLHEFEITMTDLDSSEKERTKCRIGGMLDSATLHRYSAIIDYSTCTVYFKTPLTRVWPELEEQSIAIKDEEFRHERTEGSPAPSILEFKNGRSDVTDSVRRAALEKRGYTAIPLMQEEEAGRLIVKCKSENESWWMMLDTGAERFSMDKKLAKRLDLKLGEELSVSGIGGSKKAYQSSLHGFWIAGFDTRKFAQSLILSVSDYSDLQDNEKLRLVRKYDGLLDAATLYQLSAIIDYSTCSLYLQPPLKREIEGRWVGVSGFENGLERLVDPKSPPVLEFKEDRFHLTDGAKHYSFAMHVQRAEEGYRVSLFDPKQELAEELKYQAVGLIVIKDGVLSACLCLDPKTSKGIPDDLTALPGSGRVLLEFKRDK